MFVGDDDQGDEDGDGPPASREAALAWLRSIRAELAAIPVEPPSGRRGRPPPVARRRQRPPGAAGRPEPPEQAQEPGNGPL